MFIDVIIPSYNRAALLERAINSVLAQTYQHFNLYVINDGSDDETDQMMVKFLNNPKVNYLKQKNRGVSSARNLGIKSSHAEWIAFLDSDDEWLPKKLEIQVQAISHNFDLRFFHTNEIWMRNNVRVNPKIKFDKSNKDIFKRSLKTCLISPSTVIMKRVLASEYGNFNEEFIICEDYDLWLKILACQKIGFLPDYLVIKNGGHPDQLSTRYPAMDYWRIKSLINLLKLNNLEQNKKKLISDEIKNKATIMLKGYLKHNNKKLHDELNEMLAGLYLI